ncbi:MAG: hypothetical protein PVG39_24910 [Desulfobacteraceae bacterium]
MPITLNTVPENNLIIFTHTGETSDNEFLDFYLRIFQADTFDPTKKVLIDLRETDSRPRNPDTLRQFAGFVSEYFNNSAVPPKVAIVAPKALTFGLARMYQAYTDTVPWDLVVFRAIDAALAWLKVPEDIIGGKP